MQPIERYGVAALLFLIVTIGAVVLWDRSEGGGPTGDEVAAAERSDDARSTELAGLSRDRAGQPRLPADPKGARTGEGPRRHQAGTTPPAVQVQPGPWGQRQQQPELPPKPAADPVKAKPAAQPQPAGGGQPAGGAKAGQSQAKPQPQPGGNLLNPKPRVQPKPQPRTYTVAPGDVMGTIAQDQLGSIKHLAALQQANPSVVPERMSVGTVLVLPDVGQAGGALAQADPQPAEPASKPEPAPRVTGRSYTVAEGDSFWSIAAAELGSGPRYAELQALNPGAGSVLEVGMVLRLPEGAAPARTDTLAKAETQPRAKRGVVR